MKELYEAPLVEIVEVSVEKGFATSGESTLNGGIPDYVSGGDDNWLDN